MSNEITNIVKKTKLSVEIEESIMHEFDKLNTEYVSVRHSSVIPGEMNFFLKKGFASRLNIRKNELAGVVREFWGSFFTVPALTYKIENGIDILKPLSVLMVQKMVMSEVSGICYSMNLSTGEKDQMLIEASYGLGVNFNSSVVNKDTYIVDKKDFIILGATVLPQKKMYIKSNDGTAEIEVGAILQNKQKLTNSQIVSLAKLVKHIESFYKGEAQKIEWVFFENKFYILNSVKVTNM